MIAAANNAAIQIFPLGKVPVLALKEFGSGVPVIRFSARDLRFLDDERLRCGKTIVSFNRSYRFQLLIPQQSAM